MKNNTLIVLATLSLAVLAFACCAEPNPVEIAKVASEVCTSAITSGFWGGLWHGLISGPALIAKYLFESEIDVYNACNIGGWYWFGFLTGAGGTASGLGGFINALVFRRES